VKKLITTIEILGTSTVCSLVARPTESSSTDLDTPERGVVLRFFVGSSESLNLVVTTPPGLEHSYELRALVELQTYLAAWSSEDRRPKFARRQLQDVVELSAGHLLDDEAPLCGPSFRSRQSWRSTGDLNLGTDELAIVAATANGLSRLLILAGAEHGPS
jgi:hypothetical protein